MVRARTMMSEPEVERLVVVRRVLDKELTQALGAQQLGLSVRQLRRLCTAVREQGQGALISKRRGQASNRRTPEERRRAIMELVHQHYPDFGPQLASEYLQSQHQQRISAETLRGWMIEAGLWQAKKRRAQRQHCSRPRRARLVDKTVVVLVERRTKHPIYGKIVMRSNKYKAHDEANQYNEGDTVEIAEGRPISRSKSWSVVRLIEAVRVI